MIERKSGARDSRTRPQSENTMPTASENGLGRRSVAKPTSGWRKDEVIWNASVMSPICPKSRWKDVFSKG